MRLYPVIFPTAKSIAGLVVAAGFALLPLRAQDLRLESVKYPFEVQQFRFESQGIVVEMAYMDVQPKDEPAGVVALLHGKNFSGSYFETTARRLQEEGYRVVIPDQIGFGKSTKPHNYHYSFHQLAQNTQELLNQLGVESVHVLGHSMGGMLAARFALMFPDRVQSLALLNPIGLEDWKAKGVPYRSTTDWYLQEVAKTPEAIREYQKESYYDGEWKKAYDPWVEQLATFIESDDYPRMAWNQALTYDMIYTQPVLYEFGRIETPTLLIIGQRDRTALGKDLVSDQRRAELGDYPQLGRDAQEAIPGSQLVELEDVGHLPHIEAFDAFIDPYLGFLEQHQDD